MAVLREIFIIYVQKLLVLEKWFLYFIINNSNVIERNNLVMILWKVNILFCNYCLWNGA